MGSRIWIKIHCDQWLEGPLRDETPDTRGIWADPLALAGSGKYRGVGKISLQNGVGFSDFQSNNLLKISNLLCKKASDL